MEELEKKSQEKFLSVEEIMESEDKKLIFQSVPENVVENNEFEDVPNLISFEKVDLKENIFIQDFENPTGVDMCENKQFLNTNSQLSNKIVKKMHRSRKNKINVKKKLLTCPICGKSCSSPVRKHINSHFKAHCIGCIFCGKFFTRGVEFFNHFRMYRIKYKKTPMPSELVETRLNDDDSIYKIYLNDTLQFENSARPFKCLICFKGFIRKHHLKDHYYSHKGVKPHKCEICLKPFSRKEHIKLHRLIHVGVKPYKCDICAKQFTQKSNLNKHLLIHDTKKSFKCFTCFKQFSRSDKLKEHLITYENREDHKPPNNGLTEEEAKPFFCEVCPKRYTRKDKLKYHLKSHGIELPCKPRNIPKDPADAKKPHACEICPKRFCRKDRLKKHLLTHDPLELGQSEDVLRNS